MEKSAQRKGVMLSGTCLKQSAHRQGEGLSSPQQPSRLFSIQLFLEPVREKYASTSVMVFLCQQRTVKVE